MKALLGHPFNKSREFTACDEFNVDLSMKCIRTSESVENPGR